MSPDKVKNSGHYKKRMLNFKKRCKPIIDNAILKEAAEFSEVEEIVVYVQKSLAFHNNKVPSSILLMMVLYCCVVLYLILIGYSGFI